jgi:light-regulated signal transduction histidine kinase (bacteriophytochrome)
MNMRENNEFTIDKLIKHELKTPLNSIIGFSSLLMEIGAQSEVSEYANIIKNNGTELLNKIQTVLFFEKVRNKNYEVSVNDMDLHCLTNKLIEQTSDDLKKLNYNIDVCFSKHIDRRILLNIDTEIFSRIVYHLVISFVGRRSIKKLFIGYSEENNGDILFFVSENSITGVADKFINSYSGRRVRSIESFDFYEKNGFDLAICGYLAAKISIDIWEEYFGAKSSFFLKITKDRLRG